MVGANAKNRVTDLRRQMPVSEMPGKTCQLFGISMADLYDRLRCRLYFEPSPVMQPQPVSIGHGNRLRQIEKDLFALIRYQTDTPAVTLFEQKRDGSRGLMLRPAPGGPMDRRARLRPYQYRKYRCAIGRTLAGSQVRSRPSARTSYVSGFTSMRGYSIIQQHGMLADLARVHDREEPSLRVRARWVLSTPARLTNVTEASVRQRPKAANIGR